MVPGTQVRFGSYEGVVVKEHDSLNDIFYYKEGMLVQQKNCTDDVLEKTEPMHFLSLGEFSLMIAGKKDFSVRWEEETIYEPEWEEEPFSGQDIVLRERRIVISLDEDLENPKDNTFFEIIFFVDSYEGCVYEDMDESFIYVKRLRLIDFAKLGGVKVTKNEIDAKLVESDHYVLPREKRLCEQATMIKERTDTSNTEPDLAAANFSGIKFGEYELYQVKLEGKVISSELINKSGFALPF